MHLSKFSSLLTALFLMSPAASFATLTYGSISGVSGVDTSVATKPVMYGGFAGECASGEQDNISTCNSCNAAPGATALVACNPRNTYPSLAVQIILTTDTAVNASDVTVKMNADPVNANVQAAGANGSLVISTTWADICDAAGKGRDCAQAINSDMTISTGTSGATFTIRVTTQFVDTTANSLYQDCPSSTPAPANSGFCNFIARPGDAKIVPELTISDGWPAGPNSVNFNGLVFFYEEQPLGESNADTVARISNASPSYSMALSTVISPPPVDKVISGLTNDVTYCMVMGNQDVTGVISLFTPADDPAFDFDTLCATPEPVAGLLDDKHCFIATAAFGSDMAPEVQSFRDFRNKYLIPFKWGRDFVNAYYHYSPKYAAMIAGNETAKTIVRVALWPLLFFAQMSVAFGFWATLAVLSLALLTFIELYRRLFLGRKVRGEL